MWGQPPSAVRRAKPCELSGSLLQKSFDWYWTETTKAHTESPHRLFLTTRLQRLNMALYDMS